MSEIKYRLAKPSDAGQIANVHYHIRDKYDIKRNNNNIKLLRIQRRMLKLLYYIIFFTLC